MARPILRTPLCDLLGIEYPVISAGMGPVGGGSRAVALAELTAAVSNAGGLGVIERRRPRRHRRRGVQPRPPARGDREGPLHDR